MIGLQALHDLRRYTGPWCWAPHSIFYLPTYPIRPPSLQAERRRRSTQTRSRAAGARSPSGSSGSRRRPRPSPGCSPTHFFARLRRRRGMVRYTRSPPANLQPTVRSLGPARSRRRLSAALLQWTRERPWLASRRLRRGGRLASACVSSTSSWWRLGRRCLSSSQRPCGSSASSERGRLRGRLSRSERLE